MLFLPVCFTVDLALHSNSAGPALGFVVPSAGECQMMRRVWAHAHVTAPTHCQTWVGQTPRLSHPKQMPACLPTCLSTSGCIWPCSTLALSCGRGWRPVGCQAIEGGQVALPHLCPFSPAPLANKYGGCSSEKSNEEHCSECWWPE